VIKMQYNEWEELEGKLCHVKIVDVKKIPCNDYEEAISVEFELIETGEFFKKIFYEED